ncbi:cell division topological specificity factor [Clostridium tetani]|uniref:Cell division topological specificity factor n=1 Tax=Clostridium tetani TaxID=1513 RepID=A0A4Q0UW79_CLOTA|nr:cell division topological specificity factor MinE [Clostridium tetani]CDI50255.1 septum formation topological specificity factor [Clostridium tetani 12124569]AVP55054.1 cell division topological specificity factor MinE [Clostridium tetani]KGI39053.1 cell division topological specificity factor MinE [Clostridium tetani]KGI39381.1 cell division topological specificity factor MinE [Clostridium tetani ATCC 9441]KGI43622.1 cell division topological specificity factor MinE [Clostridium tetani]
MSIFDMFSKKDSPQAVARDRLRLILIHDRCSVSPEILDKIRTDIMKVISKYVEIDEGELDVKMTNSEELEGNAPALIASIPIKSMKTR